MNVGGVVGGTIAAIAAQQEREIVEAFRQREARTVETAQTLEELGLAAGSMFRAQIRKGVVVETAGGRFYLEEVALARARRLSRQIALALTLILVLGLLAFWAFRLG